MRAHLAIAHIVRLRFGIIGLTVISIITGFLYWLSDHALMTIIA